MSTYLSSDIDSYALSQSFSSLMNASRRPFKVELISPAQVDYSGLVSALDRQGFFQSMSRALKPPTVVFGGVTVEVDNTIDFSKMAQRPIPVEVVSPYPQETVGSGLITDRGRYFSGLNPYIEPPTFDFQSLSVFDVMDEILDKGWDLAQGFDMGTNFSGILVKGAGAAIFAVGELVNDYLRYESENFKNYRNDIIDTYGTPNRSLYESSIDFGYEQLEIENEANYQIQSRRGRREIERPQTYRQQYENRIEEFYQGVGAEVAAIEEETYRLQVEFLDSDAGENYLSILSQSAISQAEEQQNNVKMLVALSEAMTTDDTSNFELMLEGNENLDEYLHEVSLMNDKFHSASSTLDYRELESSFNVFHALFSRDTQFGLDARDAQSNVYTNTNRTITLHYADQKEYESIRQMGMSGQSTGYMIKSLIGEEHERIGKSPEEALQFGQSVVEFFTNRDPKMGLSDESIGYMVKELIDEEYERIGKSAEEVLQSAQNIADWITNGDPNANFDEYSADTDKALAFAGDAVEFIYDYNENILPYLKQISETIGPAAAAINPPSYIVDINLNGMEFHKHEDADIDKIIQGLASHIDETLNTYAGAGGR